jgi:hypothetical protein
MALPADGTSSLAPSAFVRRAEMPAAFRATATALCALLVCASAMAQPADPLPSWNDGAARARIVAFVQAVTESGGKDFVLPADRIAVFDNDCTLWSDQPMHFQLAFAIDRAKAMVTRSPALAKQPVMKAAATGDLKALAATGEKGLAQLVAATHANTTSDEFAQIVRDWASTAQHPTLKRP